MRKILIRSFYYLALVIIVTFQLGSGCNSSNPVAGGSDNCGISTSKTKTYDYEGLLSSWPDTYLEEGIRTYSLYIPVDSICPHEHIDAFFEAETKLNSSRPISCKGTVEWFIFYQRTTNGSTLTTDSSTVFWRGNLMGIGLSQAFGSASGEVYINIYMSFPTLGSTAQDSVYFANNFIYAKLLLNYHYYKPAPTAKISPEQYRDFPLAQRKEKNWDEQFAGTIAERTNNKRSVTIDLKRAVN